MTRSRDLADSAKKANYLDNVTSDIDAALTSNQADIASNQVAASQAAPAGMVAPFAMPTAPSGWLIADGSVVEQATYPTLYSAIGSTWNTGGETASQFRLPDLRGTFLRGTGSHGTSSMANGNDFAGPSVGSFENDQMQNHTHTATNGTQGGASDKGAQFYGGVNNHAYVGTHTDMTTSNVVEKSSQGTPRVGSETRPFNAGVNYCIKT